MIPGGAGNPGGAAGILAGSIAGAGGCGAAGCASEGAGRGDIAVDSGGAEPTSDVVACDGAGEERAGSGGWVSFVRKTFGASGGVSTGAGSVIGVLGREDACLRSAAFPTFNFVSATDGILALTGTAARL